MINNYFIFKIFIIFPLIASACSAPISNCRPGKTTDGKCTCCEDNYGLSLDGT